MVQVDSQGLVPFSEFCAYVRQRVNHEDPHSDHLTS